MCWDQTRPSWAITMRKSSTPLFADWPEEWVALNQWIIDHLDPHTFEYLRALRPAGRYELGGVVMYLLHGEIDESVKPVLRDAPDDTFSVLAEDSNCPFVLFGHTHVQFTRNIGESCRTC